MQIRLVQSIDVQTVERLSFEPAENSPGQGNRRAGGKGKKARSLRPTGRPGVQSQTSGALGGRAARPRNRQHRVRTVTGSVGQKAPGPGPVSSPTSSRADGQTGGNAGTTWSAFAASDAPSSTRCQPCSSPAHSTSQQGRAGSGAGAEGQQGSVPTHSASPSKRQCWVAGSHTASRSHAQTCTQRFIARKKAPSAAAVKQIAGSLVSRTAPSGRLCSTPADPRCGMVGRPWNENLAPRSRGRRAGRATQACC